jgi:hypothetical protein
MPLKCPRWVRKLVQSLLPHKKANANPENTSKLVRLPPELFAVVLEFIACDAKKRDLLSMCLVCKELQREAIRTLYKDVDLGNDLSAQKAWFNRVSAHPEEAVHVHSLTLGVPLWDVPAGKKEELSRWFDSFENGMRSLESLKEYVDLLLNRLWLKIGDRFDCSGGFEHSFHERCAELFSNLPFKLHILRTSALGIEHVLMVLRHQTELVVFHDTKLYLYPHDEPIEDLSSYLPHVSDLSVPHWALEYFTSCTIRRLDHCLPMGSNKDGTEISFVNTLSSFSNTLTALMIKRRIMEVESSSYALALFLEGISRSLPLLEELRVLNQERHCVVRTQLLFPMTVWGL